MYQYLLFDLDGTVSDPKVGITTCVQYALYSLGVEEPDRDKLEAFIGPPLRASFIKFYEFDEAQSEEAVAKYRERFKAKGMFENTLYPGMKELLRSLCDSGRYLAIASSKPTVFVEQILSYFGIRQYFSTVVGSELDGSRESKEDVLEEALNRIWLEEAVKEKSGLNDGNMAELKADFYNRTVMIGDRKYDVEGARKKGIHSIGVSYGYAEEGELEAAGAERIVNSVEELGFCL